MSLPWPMAVVIYGGGVSRFRAKKERKIVYFSRVACPILYLYHVFAGKNKSKKVGNSYHLLYFSWSSALLLIPKGRGKLIFLPLPRLRLSKINSPWEKKVLLDVNKSLSHKMYSGKFKWYFVFTKMFGKSPPLFVLWKRRLVPKSEEEEEEKKEEEGEQIQYIFLLLLLFLLSLQSTLLHLPLLPFVSLRPCVAAVWYGRGTDKHIFPYIRAVLLYCFPPSNFPQKKNEGRRYKKK